MVKNVYVLAAIAHLACSLAHAVFLAPNSIVGTPQLGVPYEISWEPIVNSATIDIKKVRLQFGNGDGLRNVNVLFNFATLPFPNATSYKYTWPRNLTTTNANYTVVFQGLDATDKVLETEYITWFHLSAAPVTRSVVPTPLQTAREEPEDPPATVQHTRTRRWKPARTAAPELMSSGVKDFNLSVGAFAFALFTIVAAATW